MSKRVQCVEILLNRAERKGVATLRRGNHEVYRAEIDDSGNTVRLYHYGTLILHVENGELVQVGGWSVSDRDAINTALDYLKISSTYVRHSRNGNYLTLYIGGEAV